jgi:hypothetical protein
MAKKDTPQIPRLRAINPADWIRLLWWGLVTPETLKLHQKQHGKDAHKPIAGFIMSTLLWLPMFIVMSATAIKPKLITASNILPTAPIILTGGIVVMWLITWWLVASQKKLKENASYDVNNLFPIGISFMCAYVALEGRLGGMIWALLMIVVGVIFVAICDVLSESLKTNSEEIISLGLLTGLFFVVICLLFDLRYALPVFGINARDMDIIGVVIFVVALIIAFICAVLVADGMTWLVKNVPASRKILFGLIPLLLSILIWVYYFGM